jgi:hypothetical protein
VEYHELTAQAQKVLNNSLKSLDRVIARPGDCPAGLRKEFASAVHRLEVDSVGIRSRAEAIQARGEAYFNHWESCLAEIEDPRVRTLAERNHDGLRRCFQNIKAESQSARGSFRPFLADMRNLRIQLEKDPASLSRPPGSDLARDARKKGTEVQRILSRIKAEMDSMQAMLTPSKKNPAS